MTEKGRRLRAQDFASFAYENDGTVSWLVGHRFLVQMPFSE